MEANNLVVGQPDIRLCQNSFGLMLTGLTGAAAVALVGISVPFLTPALRRVCLPYVPATTTQVNNILKALSGRQGKLIDLGSGDGRIVVSAAKAGFTAEGVELNLWLVLYSRFAAYKSGVTNATKFYRRDLFKFSLTPYNNIVIFGVKEMMLEIEKKIEQEVNSDTWVTACRFPLPNKEPSQTFGSGIDAVWLYKYKQ